MSLLLASPALPDDEWSFRATAQSLFGHISQRFLDHRGPSCRLATAALGRCRLTAIQARAHGVLGDRVVRNSYDIDAVKAIMQVEGVTRLKQRGDRPLLGPGGLLLYDPTRPYALVNATAVRQIILQVPRELFADRALARLSHPRLFTREAEGLPCIVASTLAATAREIDALADGARARVGETLARLIATVASEEEGGGAAAAAPLDILWRRVIAFIDENLGDPDLSVDRIAATLNCSKRYVHRAFEGRSVTPDRYIWEARLERCREHLVSAAMRRWSISEIAFSTGFNSSAHFSRAFKARYGMTPRDFRALHGA